MCPFSTGVHLSSLRCTDHRHTAQQGASVGCRLRGTLPSSCMCSRIYYMLPVAHRCLGGRQRDFCLSFCTAFFLWRRCRRLVLGLYLLHGHVCNAQYMHGACILSSNFCGAFLGGCQVWGMCRGLRCCTTQHERQSWPGAHAAARHATHRAAAAA